MKKTGLLNSEISTVISQMGHKQMLTIGDAGLPISGHPKRIDLAVRKGLPAFLDVLDTVLEELYVEKIILAEEIKQQSPEMDKEIRSRFSNIPVTYVPHEVFKEYTKETEAVIRTGETTSYANIILVSGVTF